MYLNTVFKYNVYKYCPALITEQYNYSGQLNVTQFQKLLSHKRVFSFLRTRSRTDYTVWDWAIMAGFYVCFICSP